ncbi:MAG: class I SAM-dependent methyltransferase [bacterium]
MSLIINTDYEQPVAVKTKHDRQPFKITKRRNWLLEKIEIPMAVKLMRQPKSQRILQIGCGQGIALAPIFYQCRPTRLVGIDIDQRLLRRGDKRLKIREVSADLYQEDVRFMSFPDESFDVVLDFGLCYGLSQCERAIQEVARILSPGGIFVFKTKLSQLLSDPGRLFSKNLPWKSLPDLKPDRWAFMWAARRKA